MKVQTVLLLCSLVSFAQASEQPKKSTAVYHLKNGQIIDEHQATNSSNRIIGKPDSNGKCMVYSCPLCPLLSAHINYRNIGLRQHLRIQHKDASQKIHKEILENIRNGYLPATVEEAQKLVKRTQRETTRITPY